MSAAVDLEEALLLSFYREVCKDRHIYSAILAYILLTWGVSSYAGLGERFSFFVYPGTTLKMMLIFALLFFIYYASMILVFVRPSRPLLYLLEKIIYCVKQMFIWRAFILVSAFSIFFSAVSSFKSLIPALHPFSWDEKLRIMDELVHGGYAPWELLQPFLGSPYVTFFINFNYNLWFFVMFLVFFWQIFVAKRDVLRSIFLMAFVLCWAVNGSFFAVLLSSAGPCFYDLVYPGSDDPFSPLFTYLQLASEIMPVWALSTQEMLWGYYIDDELGIGSGISAMPSMHVSIAWLLLLLSFHYGFLFRILAGVFFTLILVGSVHLGWHYAIDGYFSIVTTSLIWMLVKYGYGIYGFKASVFSH